MQLSCAMLQMHFPSDVDLRLKLTHSGGTAARESRASALPKDNLAAAFAV